MLISPLLVVDWLVVQWHWLLVESIFFIIRFIFSYRILLASSPIFKNHKIILLESQSKLPKVSKDQPYSNRVCALNAQSINLFQTLGAWDLMKSIRVQEVARMQVEFFFLHYYKKQNKLNLFIFLFLVWDACSESLITFDRDNQDSLAYIVENDVIQSSLLERLKQFNVEIRLNSKVKEFEYEENSIRIKLQDDKINLRTGLLVR
jgi:2-polyprenyl-6-methoxyphenol hydroxylase-like FAD-dependent oxidoreductase